ncbi:ENTH domain containing protein, putative [Entamoeba histolytica HM-1:IMSS-B]|uniref:ENTH domain protein, putative n=6 Tax=Entamoeba histolytica TaxID=5759 RepID=C4M5V3_ENTH1|nr:ENTH domain protein, putative [Entamoeba histolytica HM-1:IMSS]EMD42930.1 ENTH domain containing protein [Entamoeba histolytica KU27]EMH75252.1 ENTH domain containing protein, putative [Entamoeba histolytica HM-1:IMSS-B]EMS17697.1 ENTH domain containing protein [Entamoeba histolytica HM-3:IMSS]ENY63133.1 ENTH domain containing protein [Entamoeba histolytica HM-1:IMSS-A]GAT96826.1 enth domain protein putative [Entamoeba histolytica]|eukprot:XP_655382.1 ENTH domain protein, putative [Entamoeba histolytica HM-1:IMSS]
MQFVDYKVKLATRKACNTSNCPPKPKHIRTIVVKSFSGGVPSFYSELTKWILSFNPLQQYKSLVTLHRVLRDGSSQLLGGYLDAFLPTINRLVNTPQQLNAYYAFQQIIKHYAKYIQIRFVFHQKHRIFTGSLLVPHELPEEYYSDQKTLSVLSYMMDLMDYLLVIPLPIIQNYIGDNCKMDCTIPLILDSYSLVKDITFFLTNLAHIEQNQSVFTFLYDRFTKTYSKLNQLYSAAKNNGYIVSLIEVPNLPPLPTFNVNDEERKLYLKKHPHSITKNNHLQKTFLHQNNNNTKEILELGNHFSQQLSKLFDLLIPPQLSSEDPESKLETMASCLMQELQNPSNLDDIKIHIWKTLIGTKYLLQQRNLDYVDANNNGEKVINELYDLQSIADKIKVSFQMNEGYEELQKYIEEFVSILSSSSANTSETTPTNQDNDLVLFDYIGDSSHDKVIQTSQDDFIDEQSFNSFIPPNLQNQENSSNEEEDFSIVLNQINDQINKIEDVRDALKNCNTNGNETIKRFGDSTQGLIDFIQIAGECEKERIREGKEKNNQTYSNNEVWSEGLLSCAKKIVEWAQYISSALMNGEPDERILAGLKQFKSHCSQLLTAARVSMEDQSPLLQRLEKSLCSLMSQIQKIIQNILSREQEQRQEIKEQNKTQDNGIESKKELMESQVRVLQLQKELEKAQNHLYSLRKEEYN